MWARASRVAAVLAGARQVAFDEPHALDRDAVGERVIGQPAIGLQAMRQCVHAGARRDGGRHADGQLGIADRDLRHHQRMEDHLLGLRRLVGDDAGAADLGAGAGRGRHGDDGQDALRVRPRPPVAHVLEVPHRPRLPGHEGDDLAGVERRAAAEGNHAVVPTGLQRHEAGLDIGGDRVGLDPRKDLGRRAVGGQCGQRVLTIAIAASRGSVTSSGRRMPAALAASPSSSIRPAPKRTDVG